MSPTISFQGLLTGHRSDGQTDGASNTIYVSRIFSWGQTKYHLYMYDHIFSVKFLQIQELSFLP